MLSSFISGPSHGTWDIDYVNHSLSNGRVVILRHHRYLCTGRAKSMTPVWDPGQPETKISITQFPPECESKISENSLYY